MTTLYDPKKPVSLANGHLAYVTHDQGAVALKITDRGEHIVTMRMDYSAYNELIARAAEAAMAADAYLGQQCTQALDILTVGQPADSPMRRLLADHIDAGLIDPAEIVARHAALERDEHPF